MAKVQVFFDYECPHCKRGYEALMEMLPSYPGVEIEWRPIEAHPRPEEGHPPHTDLSCQAYYIGRELGADMPALFKALFQGIAVEKQNVEDHGILVNLLKGVVDREKFLTILKSGKYAAQVNDNNDLAYEKNEVWFVPAFRIPGNKSAPRLDAKGGVGVTREEIKDFLEKIKNLH